MGSQTAVALVLEKHKSLIEKVTKKTVEEFFSISVDQIHSELVEKIVCKTDHIVTMGCSNSSYQGVICFALSNDDLAYFSCTHSEILDVFGELANTFCGTLMDEPDLLQAFGVLSQNVPMYFPQRAFFPRSSALSGTLVSDGHTLLFSFAVKEFLFSSYQ